MAVNKVILVGNVGKDPEIKYFDNDNVKANFSLATTERGYTAANGTSVPDRTEWHNIVCWRGLAQVAEKYIRKGSHLYIEGKIRSRSYDDQSGAKRYITEIYADNIEMLGRKGEGFENGGGAPEKNTYTNNNTAPAADLSTNSETDDLPF